MNGRQDLRMNHRFHMARITRIAASAALGIAMLGCQRTPSTAPIAFLAQGEGRWQVWWMKTPGAAPVQVTHLPQDVARLSWFPGGREVLANLQDGRLLRVDVRSGATTPVTFPFAGILDAAISPDGRRVAFSMSLADSNDRNDIWTFDLVSGERRKLTSMPGLQHEPAWRPDGTAIYFLSGKGQQTHDIWRVDVATGATEQLTVNALYHFDLAARDDGTVAYSGNQGGGNYDLWLLEGKAAPERLTHDAALDARPSWSPDGRALVFESMREDGATNLWRLDLDDKRITRLTRMSGGARMPVWAPAGGVR
jgi:TolB protein